MSISIWPPEYGASLGVGFSKRRWNMWYFISNFAPFLFFFLFSLFFFFFSLPEATDQGPLRWANWKNIWYVLILMKTLIHKWHIIKNIEILYPYFAQRTRWFMSCLRASFWLSSDHIWCCNRRWMACFSSWGGILFNFRNSAMQGWMEIFYRELELFFS